MDQTVRPPSLYSVSWGWHIWRLCRTSEGRMELELLLKLDPEGIYAEGRGIPVTMFS